MILAALLLLIQLPVSSASSASAVALPEGLATRDIPRFQMLAAGLYRGGQPERIGFEYLKKNGFKTVINLRTENDEQKIVKEFGMNYVHIPISIGPWSRIPDKAIEEYFKVLSDPANYPIFFHCRRGADRTGALAGFYRISAQGWEPQKAYNEARDVGMRWWFRAIKDQIYSFKRSFALSAKAAEAQP
jgi:tyrosine-protein phosphatase SIW14